MTPNNTSEPIVSVLIATMLKGDWQQSIASIASQSTTAFEIIIVLDRPEADAAELYSLAEQHRNIIVIENETNLGLTRSLNRAASAARGRYLVRHDDDDISSHQRIEKIIAYFDTHAEVDIVCSYAYGFLASDKLNGRRWTIMSPLTDSEIKNALRKKNCIVHPTIGIRATAFRAIGGYDERFRYAQDYDLYLRAVRAGLVFACVPEVLVKHVYSPSATTVKRRYSQATYSFAAKLLHKADWASRPEIALDAILYLVVLLTPQWARYIRRVLRAPKWRARS